MFPTTHNRSPKRNYGGLTQRVLLVTAAVTFFAGGTALAAGSTTSATPTADAPPAQSLLTAGTPDLFQAGTEIKAADPVEAEAVDPAVVAPVPVAAPDPAESADPADPADLADAADPADPADPAEPAATAQGLHGACVSAVARDKSTVGRDHGAAVSKAARSCPKGPEGAAAETDGVDKPEADKSKDAKKSEADKGTGGAEKSATGKSHHKD